MKTRDKILRYLILNGQNSIAELSKHYKISRQYLHKIMNELEDQGLVKKEGTPPIVIYSAMQKKAVFESSKVSYEQECFLREHFIAVDALGQLKEGFEAMQYWCAKQKLVLSKTIIEFIETRNKYLGYYNESHVIDGLEKLRTTSGIDELGVDQLFYLDFYAIERFGKTRLGTLMHYAKQGQNKILMKRIVVEIRQSILRLVEDQKITAIVYVPPTIKRTTQIMDYLNKHLQIELPIIKVEKLKGQIIIPQKALSKIFERIENAKNTFYVTSQPKQQHVLILDDAIGSGATINEIALKIKAKKITSKITGLAITGSYKGFEVISEV